MSRPKGASESRLVHATVAGRAEHWFLFDGADHADRGEYSVSRAVRAQSCLIEPECGDVVLVCCGVPQTASYIIAVLVRAAPCSASMVLPGGVALETEEGALRVVGRSVALHASERIALQAACVDMDAIRGDVRFSRLNMSVQHVQAALGVVSSVAQQVTSTVGRLIQKARDSVRWVEGLDETRAGRMRVQVDERLRITARNASLLAEKQVKIDGEKIDLG
jgi:hypothetical protein